MAINRSFYFILFVLFKAINCLEERKCHNKVFSKFNLTSLKSVAVRLKLREIIIKFNIREA